MNQRPEIISKLAMFLMDKEPLIYLFIINTDFIEEKDFMKKFSGYALVTFIDGRIKFIYDPEILNMFNANQIFFLILHEAFHIFKKHLDVDLYKQFNNKFLLNVAQDAVINEEISNMQISYDLKPDQLVGTVKIPEEYKKEKENLGKDAYTTKRLYYWYLEKAKQNLKKELLQIGRYVHIRETEQYGRIDTIDKNNYTVDVMTKEEMFKDLKEKKNHGNKQKFKEEQLIPVVFGNDSYHGKSAEDQTIINLNEENKEENKENLVEVEIFTKKLVQKAKEIEKYISNSAGNEVGGITRLIEKLIKPKVNWKIILNKHLNLFFSRNSSQKERKKSFITYPWNAKSRYGILYKYYIETICRLQNYIILAIDTSGSCFGSDAEIETFFSEIEAMAKWLNFTKSGKVLTIQWDTQIAEPLTEYVHQDWKKFITGKRKIKGGGGTTPEVVFNYLTKIFKKKNGSYYVNEGEINFVIPDKTKLPYLIFLTDGYFFNKLNEKDLGIYKENMKSILFFTRTKEHLFKNAENIIYE